ncbi:unnamed protein product [Ambrosiozyma monospora]|uniref:Unnamed protein product n=1 Tax=Ambrosiozyma monospora TaxID=43982 RepID=A0ACB5SY14_AMBMO|nr:unnamed protein product [Ambrosiozyma monospora]
MFIAYVIMCFVTGLNQIALAEVASLMPVTSATVRHMEHFVDEALGFAYGWISVWSQIMPGEISAAAVIVSYWTDISQGLWISIFIVVIVATNSYSIRFYGEVEFVFAIIKICLLIGLIITSIVITCGGGPNHKSIGFQYWRDPGAFKPYIFGGGKGKFVAFWKTISGVVYSYGGLNFAPALAAEVKYPRRTIFRACQRVFWRISVLMLVTVFCLTLIVPSNDKELSSSTGNSKSSPFVIAIKNAGISILPHFVNAGVLTSAFSAANLAIVHSSRVLFALAVKGQAPKCFLKTTKRGVPWVGLVFTTLFMPLAYMNLSTTSANVFGWFQNLTSANLLVGWIFQSWSHISLTRAMKRQGYSRSQLPHSVRFAPFAAWFSGLMCILFLLTGGFVNFIKHHFLISNFFSSYFIFPLTAGLYLFWKFYKGTRYLRPDEVDLASLFDDVKRNPEPPFEKLRDSEQTPESKPQGTNLKSKDLSPEEIEKHNKIVTPRSAVLLGPATRESGRIHWIRRHGNDARAFKHKYHTVNDDDDDEIAKVKPHTQFNLSPLQLHSYESKEEKKEEEANIMARLKTGKWAYNPRLEGELRIPVFEYPSSDILSEITVEYTSDALIRPIPVGSRKAIKPNNGTYFIFHVTQGTLEVTLSMTTFAVAKGFSFEVPMGNYYGLVNKGDDEARLHFFRSKYTVAPRDNDNNDPSSEERKEEEEEVDDRCW